MSTALKASLVFALVGGVVGAAALSLKGRDAQSASTPSAPAPPAAPASVVAEVNGEKITAADVDTAIGPELDKLERQIYDMRVRQVNQMIAEKLVEREAAKRGVTTDELMKAEVADKVPAVTDAEVDAFFEQNKARIPADQPDIKSQIRRYLGQQKQAERQQAYLGSLRETAAVSVTLEAPPVRRYTVSTEGAPSRGPADAPVTLVEFSDYHCPFCKRAKPTLEALLARYPEKVRLVYLDLPLDSLHPNARAAAEAAHCAGDQGKYWPFHDKLLDYAPDASPDTLKKIAGEVGLDGAAFERCVAAGTYKARVQASSEEAARLGISGTPAFLVNGRLISGAQPLEAFVKVIDEELGGTAK
jgi:protein-disulfide isomerase